MSTGDDDGSPDRREAIREYLRGEVWWRVATRAKRPIRRYRRHRAKAKAHREHVAAYEAPGTPDAERPARRPLDIFVSSWPAYLATYVAVAWVMEAAGMSTSLASFDATLGWTLNPLAVAAGGILVLAGHGIGKLFHQAKAERSARRGYAAAAAVVIALGAAAIIALGSGRDANLEAAARLKAADTLTASADTLLKQATRLEAPKPTSRRRNALVVSRADARRARTLRKRAEKLQAEADDLREAGFDLRTLSFFLALQLAGLGVSAVGGYFFTAAAPMRLGRRLQKRLGRADRCDARAQATEDRVRVIATVEIGHVMRHHGAYAIQAAVVAGRTMPHRDLDVLPDEVVDLVLGRDPLRRRDEDGHGATPADAEQNGHDLGPVDPSIVTRTGGSR